MSKKFIYKGECLEVFQDCSSIVFQNEKGEVFFKLIPNLEDIKFIKLFSEFMAEAIEDGFCNYDFGDAFRSHFNKYFETEQSRLECLELEKEFNLQVEK